MLRYFLLEVNLTLILPALSLIVYAVLLMIKFKKRNDLMKSGLQSEKDLYTFAKRRSQRVYDNAVFPFINVLNMASLFCAILDLESSSSPEHSDLIAKIEKSSFVAHITVLFVTFTIFTYEALTSYEDFRESRLTEEERARIPQTTIKKLEHDKNYLHRPNYKPGYVLIYLVYFFTLELIIIFDVMIEEFRHFGILLLIGVSLGYLILIWMWQPYCLSTNFHNKVLRFNHFVIFIFAVVCELHSRCELSEIASMSLVYFCIFCMVLVGILGYVRVYVESKFRERLSENPNVDLEFDSTEVKFK